LSNITTLYDEFVTAISAVLPDYSKIPNAYDTGSNANLFLIKGFSVGFGPATNTNRQIDCKLSVSRTLNVLLVNQITATITDFSGFNAVAKQIFEDQYTIIKEIEKHPALNTGIVVTKFVGDGGLEFLESGVAQYFGIEAQFDCEYFENLNS
jgi:hypothetical protein